MEKTIKVLMINGSPRAEGIEPRAVWHQLHLKHGGEEMRIDSTGRETQKKKSKAKSKSQLETMMFQMISACVKTTVDQAMKELFKDFK